MLSYSFTSLDELRLNSCGAVSLNHCQSGKKGTEKFRPSKFPFQHAQRRSGKPTVFFLFPWCLSLRGARVWWGSGGSRQSRSACGGLSPFEFNFSALRATGVFKTKETISFLHRTVNFPRQISERETCPICGLSVASGDIEWANQREMKSTSGKFKSLPSSAQLACLLLLVVMWSEDISSFIS